MQTYIVMGNVTEKWEVTNAKTTKQKNNPAISPLALFPLFFFSFLSPPSWLSLSVLNFCMAKLLWLILQYRRAPFYVKVY